MIFKAKDKGIFRKMMRDLEVFMGVRVVTYCFMTNHFHLLLETPDADELAPLSEDELLSILPRISDATVVKSVKEELERAHASGDEKAVAAVLARFERRRGKLSQFMKELKMRMTRYMNKRLNRSGTLWESRYKSVLVEGSELALLTVAAYIDLNPVRAGIVDRPEDYHWCGYSEAVSGTRGAKLARRGLGVALSESLRDTEMRTDWRRTSSRYRQLLYEEGEAREANEVTREGGRRGFSSETVASVVERQGQMPIQEVVRHRVRYFCDGLILGSFEFVEEAFARGQATGLLDPNRETGARKMRGANWDKLRPYRDLRKEVSV